MIWLNYLLELEMLAPHFVNMARQLLVLTRPTTNQWTSQQMPDLCPILNFKCRVTMIYIIDMSLRLRLALWLVMSLGLCTVLVSIISSFPKCQTAAFSRTTFFVGLRTTLLVLDQGLEGDDDADNAEPDGVGI